MLDLKVDGYYAIRPTDRAWEDVDLVPVDNMPPLKILQALVDGHIEHLTGYTEPVQRDHNGRGWWMPELQTGTEIALFFNEDGKSQEKESYLENPLGTLLMRHYSGVAPDDWVAGTLVVCCGKAAKEALEDE